MTPRTAVDWRAQRVALAVAHPGHELRLSTWVERAKPTVFILAAGSGHGSSRARVETSRRLAAQLGATEGALFGDYLDREVYGWIMAGDKRRFLQLAEALADSFVQQGVQTVVTDSWQFYNVAHDLWHLTVRRAVSLASMRLRRQIDCLDYEVVPPSMAGRAAGPARVQQRLTARQVQSKLGLATTFPGLAEDVNDLRQLGGAAFMASEDLHQLRPIEELIPTPGERPLYESYGEDRVAHGAYKTVLRWAHVEPIARALQPALCGDADAA